MSSQSKPTTRNANGPRYSSLAVRLHWVVALLVGLQFLLKSAMVSTMDAIRADQTPAIADYLLANLHVLSGLTIAGLMLWRLHLRLQRQQSCRSVAGLPASDQPAGLHPATRWQVMFKPLASGVHWAFYVLLLLLPATGLLAYYELSLAASVHRWCQRLLLALLFMHILAALIHHFLFRDDALGRITGKS